MMNRQTAQHNQKRHKTKERATKDAARASLMDCMAVVQASVAAMPEVVHFPRNLSEAFLLSDNILSMINRQLLDARAQMAQLTAMFGADDPMLEALAFQMAALERAYAERLTLLMKKREDAARQLSNIEIMTGEKKLTDVRRGLQPERRKNYGTLWLWAVLVLGDRKTSGKKYGLVPNAA